MSRDDAGTTVDDGPDEPRDGGVRRGAALMASGTAVSRVLGLLRGMVLVGAVGATGQAADAFAVANKLPNILYLTLAGGLLNAVLVPQVVRAFKRGGGREYVDRLLTLGFAALAVVAVGLTLAAPLLVDLYTDPGDPARRDLAVAFAWWCIPQLFFYGVYALLGQVLNARGSFGPYMWAPVVNNVVALVGFGVFIAAFGPAEGSGLVRAEAWTPAAVTTLGATATLGVVAQALVLLPALRRAGIRYRPRLGLRGSGLGRAGATSTWTFVGLLVGQVGYLVVSRVATEATAGRTQGVAGVFAYDQAFLVFMLPHSLVTVSLATALFTRLSGQAHDGDVAGVRATLSLGLRTVGLFTVPATALLVVLAEPVTRLILISAPPGDAEVVARVVVAMLVGLPFFGAWSLCQRVYYADEDARGLIPTQVAMAAVVGVGTLLGRAFLPREDWVVGAGVAMSVSYALGTVVSLVRLHRRLGGVDAFHVVRTHVRVTIGALVAAGAGAAALAGLHRVVEPASPLGALLACVVVGALMGGLYVAVLRLLHVRELDTLAGPALRAVSRVLRRR
ncbi:murein biosynthesis integral membrane protein MurJ [Cellulomonas endophytica]|uniref:murein biosynthesis integral membrane protein MurJ n=1 Tax=Cellulomonas endophytica TaxID=2494735 RepID=UPI001F0BE7B7|nr:murein biosynthesis integral membrane protein MurJ [Cellulomonas endophytica]